MAARYVINAYIDSESLLRGDTDAAVRKLCDSYLKKFEYQVFVYDLHKKPEVALKNQIIATPTFDVIADNKKTRFVGSIEYLRIILEFLLQREEALRMVTIARKISKNIKAP